MDLTDYPNLEAIFDGRVSRAHDEWPQVRVELWQLLDAAANLEQRVEAFEQLQQAVSVLSANITRLEEEKAQAVKRAQVLADDKCRHFYDRAVQSEAREAWVRSQLDAQYLAGVEWGVKHVSKREDWPQSWDAGFPGFKGQALIDRGPLSPDAGRAP